MSFIRSSAFYTWETVQVQTLIRVFCFVWLAYFWNLGIQFSFIGHWIVLIVYCYHCILLAAWKCGFIHWPACLATELLWVSIGLVLSFSWVLFIDRYVSTGKLNNSSSKESHSSPGESGILWQYFEAILKEHLYVYMCVLCVWWLALSTCIVYPKHLLYQQNISVWNRYDFAVLR